MEIYQLPDKKFRIILLNKFGERQENTDRKQNKIRKSVHEQNEMFNTEIETIKKSNRVLGKDGGVERS